MNAAQKRPGTTTFPDNFLDNVQLIILKSNEKM